MSARRCRRPRNHWRRNTARRSRAGPPGDPGDVPDRVHIRRRRPPQTRPLIRRLPGSTVRPRGPRGAEARSERSSSRRDCGCAAAKRGRSPTTTDRSPGVPRDFRRRPRARWWRRTLRRTAQNSGAPPVPDRVAEVEGPHTVPGDERNLSGASPAEADGGLRAARSVRVRELQARHALERGRDVNRLERVGGTKNTRRSSASYAAKRTEGRSSPMRSAMTASVRSRSSCARIALSTHAAQAGARIPSSTTPMRSIVQWFEAAAAAQQTSLPHPQSAGSADPSGGRQHRSIIRRGSTGGPRAGRLVVAAPRMELLAQLLEALDGAVEVQVLAATLPAPGAHLTGAMRIPQHSRAWRAPSPGGTSAPWTPSSISSRTPPTRVAIGFQRRP